MAIATRLKWYLESRHVDYEVVHHPHSRSSRESARAAHLPDGKVVKCVLLEDEGGYLMAVVPSSCRLLLPEIRDQMHRELELASEAELAELFGDCELGALPPAGMAYNIPMVIDDSLLRLPDVYVEAGDHEDLVHLSGEDFRALVARSHHGRFSRPH